MAASGIYKTIKLLLVEDDPDDVYLISRALEKNDKDEYSLAHVATLTDAIKSVKENSYDAVILDLGLSDSQGLQTLQNMLAHIKGTPLIVLTGTSSDFVNHRAMQLGADEFLAKHDLDFTTLQCALEYCLERSETGNAVDVNEKSDHLTGFLNQQKFVEVVQEMIAEQAAESSLGLLLIDIDRFDLVNSMFGNDVGDEVLNRFAAKIQECYTNGLHFARLHADTFALVVRGFHDIDALIMQINKAHDFLGDPILLKNSTPANIIQITMGIGVAIWEPDMSADRLLAHAHIALGRSKKTGRNKLSVYE